jgi:hypothetical protein
MHIAHTQDAYMYSDTHTHTTHTTHTYICTHPTTQGSMEAYKVAFMDIVDTAVFVEESESIFRCYGCVFNNNYQATTSNLTAYSAAIEAATVAEVTVVDTLFRNCSAGKGPAVTGAYVGSLRVESSTFIGNTARVGHGGAIHLISNAASLGFVNCTFVDNSANVGWEWLDFCCVCYAGFTPRVVGYEPHGWVVVAFDVCRCLWYVCTSQLTRNQQGDGGVLYKVGSGGDVLVSLCVFTGNSAGGSGSAVSLSRSVFVATNSSFVDNVGWTYGALHVYEAYYVALEGLVMRVSPCIGLRMRPCRACKHECAHTHARSYIHTKTHTHTRTHTHIHTRIHSHAHTRPHVHARTRTRSHVHTPHTHTHACTNLQHTHTYQPHRW